MRLSHAAMYSRLVASDPTWNGHFFTGVKTTGIYCLPSCGARKPRAENVRFFPTAEAAREAGFRACLKCHPDDYARGADPVLETIEAVVGELRARPAAFADARAVVRRSGFGTTRCFELFRQHFHSTPAGMLVQARVDAARRHLAESGAPLTAVADEVGFESLSAFHQHFQAENGLTPGEFRRLRSPGAFTLALPPGYALAPTLRFLGRDPHSLTERLTGTLYECSTHAAGAAGVVRLELSPAAARVTWVSPEPFAPAQHFAVHRQVAHQLGLDQDAAGFGRLARRLGLGRLVAGRPGLRLIRTPSVFDGLLWSIVGQQIHFAFACALKRRLIEHAGTPIAGGLYLLPAAAAVAELHPEAMRPWQYSQKKAEYLVGAAREVAAGRLDLAALRTLSATRAERTLLGLRGLGPWSVNYVLMRSLGFADCVPLGDTGVTSGLQSLLQLEERPDLDATRRLMAVFSPQRSLATAHLWQLNQPEPSP